MQEMDKPNASNDAPFTATRGGRLVGFLRRLPLPLIVLTLGICVFMLLISTRPETKPRVNKERVWSVSARNVSYDIFEPQISVFGELRAKRQVRLRALVSGEVVGTDAKFEDGARVAEGDVLLTIDPFT